MKRIITVFMAIIILTGCIESAETQEGELLQAVVTKVTDGDTFTVKINGVEEKVRPILVDAPEICHWNSGKDCEPEPFGNEATAFAEDTLLGETVYLEQDVSERDRYGRLLFYVYLSDGQMFQELLLAEGLAEVAVFEPDVKYKDRFFVIQEQAQKEKVGIWH
ncbi:thermonuclease family protein [Shouchella clausii]|uniref:thermonuclease family protein n=1 Tax=Shouchella clausii TaxID=79880 RepID=UPI0026F46423|nr:thermonuclease family protein [Shouchella clausii]MDO7285885.1 thermonuclease family protein [Shouchella clausii]MDO7305788.1 thermonuclease family protein [Shouchella clausii]